MKTTMDQFKYQFSAIALAIVIGVVIGGYFTIGRADKLILEQEEARKQQILKVTDSLLNIVSKREQRIDSLGNLLKADSVLVAKLEEDIQKKRKEIQKLKDGVKHMTPDEKVNWIRNRYKQP